MILQKQTPGKQNNYAIMGQGLSCQQPDLTFSRGDVFWGSYSDYLMRNLSVEIQTGNTGDNTAHNLKHVGAIPSSSVTSNSSMPVNIGDLSPGSSHAEIFNFTVPLGVARFRLVIYSSAQDECGNIYEYPAPYAEDNPNATIVGDANAVTAGDTTIAFSMPYTGDANQNNTYTVKYKPSAAVTWSDWGDNPKGHSSSPYTDRITGLHPGESYDVMLTYSDYEGVLGESSQTVSGIVMPVYPPAAPTIGTVTALSPTSVRWRFADNAYDESGFSLHDDEHVIKADSATPDLSYLDETGLVPNTRYARHLHAYNTAGDSAASATASVYTLSAAPAVTSDKTVSSWSSDADVTFTNTAGFGSGGVEYYRYAFNQSPTHTFTGFEPQWVSDSLVTTATADGAWYLHVKSYNGDGTAAGTADYGPYLYDGEAPYVAAFSAPATSMNLSIPIAAFSAVDNIGVTGYQVTTSPLPPSPGSGAWTEIAPTAYSVAADGTYSLYPWAMDAAGNVSAVPATIKSVVVDTLPPAVAATTPNSSATGVALNESVTVNFSESIDCSTVDINSVRISSGGWALSSCSGSRVVFATSGQTRSTAYTVSVGGSVKDLHGNTLLSDYQFSYMTEVVPKTHTVCPAGCDFMYIQGAINDPGVVDGDTIVVSYGIYSENINFKGKAITVKALSGAGATILQGSGANSPVVTFNSGETAGAVLEGFTIDNQAAAGSNSRGIYINGASPTIRDCSISGNFTSSNRNGGGIFIYGSGADVSIADTKVTLNNADGRGGGVYISGGAHATITRSRIEGNRAISSSGGGIAVVGSPSTLTISGSYIRGNWADQYGGGLYSTASASITNCTITGNITDGASDGGGIFNDASLDVMNSTIAGNYSARYGGGIRHNSGNATITNSIVWGNNAAAGNGPNISGTPDASYSDIEGGFAGSGNIDIDPSFYTLMAASAGAPRLYGNYHIQRDSAVIDQGTGAGAPADDIDGDPRPIGLGFDMGSDEDDHIVIIVPGWP